MGTSYHYRTRAGVGMIAEFRTKDPTQNAEHLGSFVSLASSMLATPATATLSAPSNLKIQGFVCIRKTQPDSESPPWMPTRRRRSKTRPT